MITRWIVVGQAWNCRQQCSFKILLPEEPLCDFAQEQTDQGKPQDVYSFRKESGFHSAMFSKMSLRGCVMISSSIIVML